MKCLDCKRKLHHLVIDWFICKCGMLWSMDDLQPKGQNDV